MKRIIIISCLLYCILQAGLTQNYIDSLEEIINNAKGNEKVDLLNKYSSELLYESLDNSYIFAEDALKAAKRNDYFIGQVDAMLNIGNVFYQKYEDSIALDYFYKALRLSYNKDYNLGKIQALTSIGLSFYDYNILDSSIYYSNKALEIAHNTKNKTEEGKILQNIGNVYRKNNNLDTAIQYYEKSLKIREALKDYKDIAKTNNQIGLAHYQAGKYKEAIESYKKAIELRDMANDLYGKGIDYYNMGNALREMENYEEAIESYQVALSIFEKTNHIQGIANCYNSLGFVNDLMQNSQKATSYYKQALSLFTTINDKLSISDVLDNIGTSISNYAVVELQKQYGYSSFDDSLLIYKPKKYIAIFDSVLYYYLEALKIRKEIGDQLKIAKTLNNIGVNYSYIGEFDLALKYYEESLPISVSLNEEFEIINTNVAIARTYNRMNMYSKAIQYLFKYLDRAISLGKNDILLKYYEEISLAYHRMGDTKKALEYYMLYTDTKEKYLNEERLRQTAELETKYETEKKEAQLQLQDQQIQLQDATIKRRNQVIIFFIIGFILILASAVMLLRLNRQINKANVELAHKNELISKQKEEITDSIKYARRIQRAVIPTDEVVKTLLPEHFILFRPRDIVSGDFYWLGQKKNKVIAVAADCTGHGVPGAFMSMLGISFLNEIVNKEEVTQANLILNELRTSVKTTLSQTGAEGEAKDGMDIALVILDTEKRTLQFAGAYNPLYLFRNGEFIEIKADKMPIGIYIKEKESFTNNEMPFQKDDIFYIFSDGYVSQFGGEDKRKFMTKNFKELLTEINMKPMDEQREILNKAIDDWRGDIPQVDDIIVMGVRLS